MDGCVTAFDDLTDEQQQQAGSKGSTLARLHQAGYPVPDGFVVLPDAFSGDEMTPQAWAAVRHHLSRLRGGHDRCAFAVRSSALAEDSVRASFAGEFETVLDMRTDDEVRSAIHAVRRSRHSERVRAYTEAQGLDPSHEIAVVVQRLVRATISGVLFTADPVTGSRERMIGNYVHGLGEKLVSGEVNARDFALARPRGHYEGPPDLIRPSRPLFRLARRLERELGRPQDIEWAIVPTRGLAWPRDKVFILQSRPITTLLGFDPVSGEFNDSLTGDYLWSCVNVGEAVSVVMTPLTWSMMHAAFSELNILPGHASVGNIGGRLYQNSTVMASVLRALGKNIKDMVQEIGGVRHEYLETMDQYLIPLPEATLLAVLPNGLRARRKEKRAFKGLDTYLAENPGWCDAMRRRIRETRTTSGLISKMDELMPKSLDAFWRNYATALRYAERVGQLRRELRESVVAEDADALLSNVSGGGELLASLGPLVGLARVAKGELSRDAYLKRWGHRGALETELSASRPAEDPAWLDRQLAMYNETPIDVAGQLAAQRAEFQAAWERFQSRYPRQAQAMGRRLEQAAEDARLREAARSESTRLIWVMREWAIRAGDLTGIADGVFFLTLEELLALLDGDEGAVRTIPARRQTYQRYKGLPPYPMVIRGRFDPVQWAADPNRRTDFFDSHGLLPTLTAEPPSEFVILGMPGSAGQVEGTVRRLDDPDHGDSLRTGEVLVTSQTNIGWTLFFPRAAAIVTDIGAPLSHAAIVARELGIPAVVNCGDATVRLHTGDRVRVDGTQGCVAILEAAKAN